MEKNFVKFVQKLIQLSDKETHKKFRDEFITSTVNKQSNTQPDKIEFDRELGIVTTTYKRGAKGELLDKKHHSYQKNRFDHKILDEAEYHFEKGFFEFFQGKDKDLIKAFVDETLPELKTAQKKVTSLCYFDNYSNLKETLEWVIFRLDKLDIPQKSIGREPDFNYEIMIEWFHELAALDEYQKASGKPHLTLIDNEIQNRFKLKTGQTPAPRTIRNYRQKFGLT